MDRQAGNPGLGVMGYSGSTAAETMNKALEKVNDQGRMLMRKGKYYVYTKSKEEACLLGLAQY